jgi:enamine deaminase RidA (YjgF/YER057c/UK114 family)
VPEEIREIKAIKSEAPQPLAHYREGVKTGPWAFASDYKTGVAPAARREAAFPYYGSDIKLQTRYVLDNPERTFAAAGSSLDKVVKAQVFLTDLNNLTALTKSGVSILQFRRRVLAIITEMARSLPKRRNTLPVAGLIGPGDRKSVQPTSCRYLRVCVFSRSRPDAM